MNLDNYYKNVFKIEDIILKISKQVDEKLNSTNVFSKVENIIEFNQFKILNAMQNNKLSDIHFNNTNGYGYNDIGRDIVENIFCEIFKAEAALVRPQIVSGTHALSAALFGNLKHGDKLLSISGKPYDTLLSVIGTKKSKGSLIENGIIYEEIDFINNDFDYKSIEDKLIENVKIILIQRSKGYSNRESTNLKKIQNIIKFIKSLKKDVICLVDNCYGEFVDFIEPIEVGADIVVGSLIKNPGGGLASSGGYIVGKLEYIENSSYRLIAPGIGREVGPMLGMTQQILQGLFLAPQVVGNAIKSAIFASLLFENLGFEVCPKFNDIRSDIVQSIKFDDEESLIVFCQSIQTASPVDSHVKLVPYKIPGYDCDIIMAAGCFVQGSSIELSADSPIRKPYTAFLQGGLSYFHSKMATLKAASNLYKLNKIKIN